MAAYRSIPPLALGAIELGYQTLTMRLGDEVVERAADEGVVALEEAAQQATEVAALLRGGLELDLAGEGLALVGPGAQAVDFVAVLVGLLVMLALTNDSNWKRALSMDMKNTSLPVPASSSVSIPRIAAACASASPIAMRPAMRKAVMAPTPTAAITADNAAEIAKAGANALVAGSAIFKGKGVDDYRKTVDTLRKAAEGGRG